MLIDIDIDKEILWTIAEDPVVSIFFEYPYKNKRLEKGIYETCGEHLLTRSRGWYQFPEIIKCDNGRWTLTSSYGVCDHYKQVIEHFPEFVESDRKFVLYITPKESELYHKDGIYVGDYNYDDGGDPDQLYYFQFYELLEPRKVIQMDTKLNTGQNILNAFQTEDWCIIDHLDLVGGMMKEFQDQFDSVIVYHVPDDWKERKLCIRYRNEELELGVVAEACHKSQTKSVLLIIYGVGKVSDMEKMPLYTLVADKKVYNHGHIVEAGNLKLLIVDKWFGSFDYYDNQLTRLQH